MFFDIAALKNRYRNIKVALLAGALLSSTVISGASADRIEDPQTAEREWSAPNLNKIQTNYKGPKLSKADAGDTQILISFLLFPNGKVRDVKSEKNSGELREKNDVDIKQFKAIQAGLVDAIKRSAPLVYRKREHEAKVPWGVVFVYCPKDYEFARMIHVARGKDRL